jgi:hypothetical protein
MKRTPLKRKTPLKKVREGKVKKDKSFKVSNEEMRKFYNKIFSKRGPYSELSGKYLGAEPRSYMFDHLLEKSKYPQFADNEWNIVLCTLDEHHAKTNGFPTLPHRARMERFKELVRNNYEVEFWTKNDYSYYAPMYTKHFLYCGGTRLNYNSHAWDRFSGKTHFLFFSALNLEDDVYGNLITQLTLRNSLRKLHTPDTEEEVPRFYPDNSNKTYDVHLSYKVIDPGTAEYTRYFTGIFTTGPGYIMSGRVYKAPSLIAYTCENMDLSNYGRPLIEISFGNHFSTFENFLNFYNNV